MNQSQLSTLITKYCVVCGKEIVRKPFARKDQKYCSKLCRSRDYYKKYYTHFEWQKNRKCPRCSKEFLPIHPEQLYCSATCRRAVWKHKNAFKWQIEMTCPICSKKFVPDSHSQKFCSYPCQYQNEKGHPYKPQIDMECPVCQNSFVANRSDEKYCSNKCLATAEHLRYRYATKEGGGALTLEDWNRIKKQFGNKCAICGKTEQELLERYKKGLTVDHKIPVSKWVKWKKSHPEITYNLSDPQNIQPLCLGCNARKSNNM